ncbi:MAG: hypothetical protein QM537_04565, partial [Candidatus Symbiobacter sp.]|nr:hypothetical protein [Candidatus Symbiobacter sp.]
DALFSDALVSDALVSDALFSDALVSDAPFFRTGSDFQTARKTIIRVNNLFACIKVLPEL